jgi:hypothetical protein
MQQTFEHVVDAWNAGVVHGDGHGALSMQVLEGLAGDDSAWQLFLILIKV